MSDTSDTRVAIAEDAAQPASSSRSTDAVEDFPNLWLDYWHDGGFTEPGGLAFAPHTYSFDGSSPSFFPIVDTVEGSRLEGSSSATVPRTAHYQRGVPAEFKLDYDSALRDVLLHREEQEKLGEDESELHRRAPSGIPFPSLDADEYRDADLREQHRQRVRSMGASSQRGTRKESGRRDSGRREGLRATKNTESLDEMKKSALELYLTIRYKLQVGLSREDVDDEEDPKWLSPLLVQCAAGSSEAKSTRGGGRRKEVA